MALKYTRFLKSIFLIFSAMGSVDNHADLNFFTNCHLYSSARFPLLLTTEIYRSTSNRRSVLVVSSTAKPCSVKNFFVGDPLGRFQISSPFTTWWASRIMLLGEYCFPSTDTRNLPAADA